MNKSLGTIQEMVSFTGKRKVLIVEDNQLNIDILTGILEDEYTVLTATNGEEGLKVVMAHYRELSLIFLDVYMPVLDGFEFLKALYSREDIPFIPVIVTTSSNLQADEIKCLELGALEFVVKPYNRDIVKARTKNIISLRESVATLSAVEHDPLTGYLTIQAFQHYMTNYLISHSEEKYNLVVADIIGVRNINSIYGEKVGDDVIKFVSTVFRSFADTILCARKEDKFFFLCNGAFTADENTLRRAQKVIKDSSIVPNLDIKYGIYINVDTMQSVSVLCDRALFALDQIKSEPTVDYAIYDETIHSRVLKNILLESKFAEAVEKEEFALWFQPKISLSENRVVGAEALVRWITLNGEIISPGEFIPLFETDGYIQILDEYIFKKACLFQKERIDKGLKTVPVSVNLSRNSVYISDVAERYSRIVKEIGIPSDLISLEITESAANESREVLEQVKRLSEKGFKIDMDDFGTGYSSLSSLISMEFDGVKLDKSIIDKLKTDKGKKLIEYTIVLAHDIGMHVIAEGVEKKDQVEFLKKIKCDIAQGYYFYQPKNQKDFELLLDAQ
ncbi:MAG: EAL domain-containing protein [Oscillospiraceae bacterium]|nr:EAL domain-containing protein [Oscillospiraceae bacterium]